MQTKVSIPTGFDETELFGRSLFAADFQKEQSKSHQSAVKLALNNKDNPGSTTLADSENTVLSKEHSLPRGPAHE